MRLVSLQMRGSVVRNYIYSLIWRCYGPKRDILEYFETNIFVYYPIVSYQNIKVYRFETMDMGKYHWNNGVSGTVIISIGTMVLIVRYKIIW